MFSLFLPFSLFGQELSAYTGLEQLMLVNEGAARVEPPLEMMPESAVLDEIEKLQARLDHLILEGGISRSTAFFASGILATIVYTIMHTGFGYFVRAIVNRIEGEWLVEVCAVLFLSVLPGAGLGALLSYANYTDDSLPHLPAEESLGLGVRGVIYASGFWLASNIPIRYLIGSLEPTCYRGSYEMMVFRCITWWAFAVLPMTGFVLYKQIMRQRSDLRDEIFDIEVQMKEAREILRKRESIRKGRRFRSF